MYVSLGMDMVKQTAMKKELTEIYEKTKSLFYPGHMMDGLKEIMDVITKVNYLENISANLQKLESEECPILVAGKCIAFH